MDISTRIYLANFDYNIFQKVTSYNILSLQCGDINIVELLRFVAIDCIATMHRLAT